MRHVTAPRAWSPARGYALMLVVPGLFLVLFFVVPLVWVALRSVLDPEPTMAHYVRVFTAGPYVRVLWNTIETAAVVAVLCLVIAYPVAAVVAFAREQRFRLLMALILIPLWTSAVIRSYAWMIVFQRRGVINDALQMLGLSDTPIRFLPGSLAVHVGMVHLMLPFMLLPLIANMRGIDRNLLRAAEVLGANPVRRFIEIFVPLSRPGIGAGLTLVFMTSLGFFVTPALLGGPQHMMAAVLIEQLANTQLDWPLASALSTTLLAVTIAIYLVYLRVMRGGAVAIARA